MVEALVFQFTKNKGHFLENLIFLELRRRYPNIYYYKTAHNLEVDFAVLQGNKIVHLIQVCADISDEKTRKREISALVKALQETGLSQGLLLTDHQSEKLTVDHQTIIIQPAYQWLLTP